jgi:hypothetical protein
MAPTTLDVAKEAMAAVEKLQTDVTATQERLNSIEVIADDMKTKITSMDAMIQSIYKAVMNTTTDSEPPSAAKVDNSALTDEELAFLKKQEAEGKIILHTEPPIFTGKSDPNASTSVLHEEPKGKNQSTFLLKLSSILYLLLPLKWEQVLLICGVIPLIISLVCPLQDLNLISLISMVITLLAGCNNVKSISS